MRTALWIVGLLIAFVLQAQIGPRIASPGFRPDFILAVIIAASLCAPGQPPAIVALVGGLLEGMLCGLYMTAFVISRLVAALVASFAVEPFNLNFPIAFIVSILAAASAQVIFLLVRASSDVVWWLNAATRQTVLTGLLTLLVLPLALRIFESLKLNKS